MDEMITHEEEMFNKSFNILAEFETADEIAAFFKEQGIVGKPMAHDSCAISEYMKSNVL